jgi:hypothetical protein
MRLLVFLALLAVADAANAACPGRFAYLAKYVGEIPDSALIDPAISSRMTDLMGTQVRRLKTNLSAAVPVALINCELVVEGNAPHQGGQQNAMLSFNLYDGIMTVAILEGDRILVRATKHRHRDPSNYSHLPAHVRDWIYVAANHFSLARNAPGERHAPARTLNMA